ncbi:hypothetical protein, partial [Faecalibaculum rodentium]|uniref:hypothetical protein n=1 Tax=Faecalibaculum rodentium TaxID=1702221 RepID=UPI0023F374E5
DPKVALLKGVDPVQFCVFDFSGSEGLKSSRPFLLSRPVTFFLDSHCRQDTVSGDDIEQFVHRPRAYVEMNKYSQYDEQVLKVRKRVCGSRF